MIRSLSGCNPINLVKIGTLSGCNPINLVKIGTLSGCNPINLVKIGTLSGCNPINLSRGHIAVCIKCSEYFFPLAFFQKLSRI